MSTRTLAKIGLAAVTVLLLLSMGGGFLALPLLSPAHVWMARRSGRVGRVLWSMPAAIGAAMVAWAAFYVVFGESQPWIWLVPVAGLVAAAFGLARLTPSATAQPA